MTVIVEQSYDNEANLSGAYNGLQAQINNVSSSSRAFLRAAQSLVLVGETVAASNDEAVGFFAL